MRARLTVPIWVYLAAALIDWAARITIRRLIYAAAIALFALIALEFLGVVSIAWRIR